MTMPTWLIVVICLGVLLVVLTLLAVSESRHTQVQQMDDLKYGRPPKDRH